MSNRSLPFYTSFFNILEKYNIEKWEAKDFIAIILERLPNTLQNKQLVYQGINVLVQCGYLKRILNPHKKNTFLYSETESVSKYRCTKNQENIAKALNAKMDAVQGGIMKKKIEVDLINELKDEYPNIASQLVSIEQEHIKSLNDLATQQNVIKNLMSRFDINKEQ